MMGKTRFLLDSNVLIDTLNRKLDLLAFLSDFPDCEAYINMIVAIVVLSKPGMCEQEEADIRALQESFKWAEIDRDVCEIAVKIRRTGGLRLPDALIAATSVALNATVVSNDSHILGYSRSGYSAIPSNRESSGAL